MPLRLESFKNSESPPTPDSESEGEPAHGLNPPTFAGVSAGADFTPGSSVPAAPLDESPEDFNTRILLRLQEIFLTKP